MKKKILIISGDPNSINSEILFKSWIKINSSIKKKIYLISNYELLKSQFKRLNYKIDIIKVKNVYEHENNNKLKIINIDLEFNNSFKVPKKLSSRFIIQSLDLAHKIALDPNISGIINCAIDKKLLNKSNIGVTEYFANKCNIKDNSEVMMIRNDKLSVCPITTHLNIKDVAKNIKSKLIVNKVKTIDFWFRNKFKKKPKIAVLGLNPHNAEFRKSSEERKIILPSLIKLKKSGINLDGPLVADNIFIKDYKNYDVIVGMYHDQVLIPFKLLFKYDAINLTLGLKYIRVSPDHGTAANIIMKKKSNPLSLLKCIKYINNLR
jgi:4-hydroxy-L-threonine phosphate dehydrogenase PdxA